jgi:hypothetical protein
MNENRILRQLNEYLNYKHSLGFKLKHEETVFVNGIIKIPTFGGENTPLCYA